MHFFAQLTIDEARVIIREEIQSAIRVPEVGIEKPVPIEVAADFAGLNEQTVYRLLREGKFPGHKRNGKWSFFLSELSDWIKNKN